MRPGVKELVIPPKEYLDECFHYYPETGHMAWKRRPMGHFSNENKYLAFNGARTGKPAGCVHFQKGKAACVQIRLDGHLYRAHRLIFRMMGVEIPEGMMGDHENRNPIDNRWSNLRIATRTENNRNGGKRRNNTSGFPGVQPSKTKGKFVAFITVDLKALYLGTFLTKEDAVMARRSAEQRYFKEYAPR
jgi:hypothetical protein